MTNAPIRILVIMSVLLLVGVISTQVYWANRAIDSQQQQFTHSVQMALRNVVESVCEINGTDVPSNNPIEQVSSNYFIVRTNSKIDLSSLEYILKAELEKRAIVEDFEYGVYDCQNNQMVFGNLVSQQFETIEKSRFPALSGYDYFFGLYFPSKTYVSILDLDLWRITTALTLLIMVFFGYALFIVFRQKKLSTVQRDFVNNITHEFKTPISTLKVAADLLKKPQEMGEQRLKKYAELVGIEAGRLERHVEQLLKSAEIENRKNVKWEKIDISKLAREICDYFIDQNAEVKFNLEIKENIEIKSDRYLFEIILYNLVDNAIKYGNKTVEVKLFKERNKVILEICDDGPGIPSKHKRNVFKKFYRVSEGDRHDVKGFGLGLYVVNQSVSLLQGKISLAKKNGAAFRIELPE